MSKAPAFQLFAADFYMDTNSWSALEVGIYFRLLMEEWVNGAIPDDILRLSRIAGVDKRTMQKCWFIVGSKFHKNDAGMLINIRLEETRDKQIKQRELQHLKGISGAEKRWQGHAASNACAIAGVQPDHSSSSSLAALESKEKDLKAAFADQIEIIKPEPKAVDPEQIERNLIMDMAPTMVNDSAVEVANLLSCNGFREAHKWMQKQRNFHMNPRAILLTLKQCHKHHPDNPWAYCNKIIKIENGNFNEQDYRRDH